MSARTNANWVNNVMTWDLNSDNTNLATITGASLGRYIAGPEAFYHDPADKALNAVQHAAGWGSRSRLKPMIVVARMLKRHFDDLLSSLKHYITNAVTEGLNSKIQSLKSAARGFRNFKNHRTRI